MNRFIFRKYYQDQEASAAIGIDLAQLLRMIEQTHIDMTYGHPFSYKVEGFHG